MKNSFQIKAADVFVTCGDFTASVCRLRNTSAVSIDYKVGEVTTALAAGAASGAINVSNSTREVSVRRADLNSSAVSVLIEWGLTADEAYELASSEVYPVAAAHNADAYAHGFGVYTVAQLNAFTSTNRPTGCVYCADCLVPEGVGSPVVWNGTAWVCTCSNMPVTTDLVTWYRALALNSGYSGNTKRTAATSSLPAFSSQNSGSIYPRPESGIGSGPTIGIFGSSGSSATAGVRVNPIGGYGVLSTARAQSFYRRFRVGFSVVSDATNCFNFRDGCDGSGSYSLGVDALGWVYDNGNTLGALNPTSTNTLIFFSRSASVNALVDTGVAVVGGLPTEFTLEMLFDGTSLIPYINGVAYTPIAAASVPANLPLGFFAFNKSAGTTARTFTHSSGFSAVRYATPES